MITNLSEFLKAIPTEISVAIIGVLSVSISAFLSAHISKATTMAEISAEKERREDIWRYEHENAYNTEFAEMVTSITAYLRDETEENYKKSIAAINVLRVKELSDLAKKLDMLYFIITDRDYDEVLREQLAMELNLVVAQKRKNNRQQASTNH